MAKLTFTPNLTRHVSCPNKNVQGEKVIDVLKAYFNDYPRVEGYVLDERGRLRKHMAIAINNELYSNSEVLQIQVNDDDEIFVLQALSGG